MRHVKNISITEWPTAAISLLEKQAMAQNLTQMLVQLTSLAGIVRGLKNTGGN